MTFTEAAAQVLRLVGKPLHYKEITDVAIEKDLLSHVGKSPEVTMGARLAALAKKGDKDNPLVRVKPGVFALREWDKATVDKGLQDRTPALERIARQATEELPANAGAAADTGESSAEPERQLAAHEEVDDDANPPDAEERRRAEFAANAGGIFEAEDDDDEPIFGAEPEEEERQESGPRRRRRRRRRGRGDAEVSDGDDDLPSYTVSDVPDGIQLDELQSDSAPAPVERAQRSGRNRRDRDSERDRDRDRDRDRERDRDRDVQQFDTAVGRGLADAIAQLLNGYDKNRGSVSLQSLCDTIKRAAESSDIAPSASLLAAAARCDNVRRAKAGQRVRFRLNGNRVALEDWSVDPELLNVEQQLLRLLARHRELSQKALARALQGMPHRAFGELTILLLEQLGLIGLTQVRRPGSHGAELHLQGTLEHAGSEVRIAVVVRRDGREIGRERVTELRGALHHYGPAAQGYLVTSGQILSGAREEARAPGAAPVTLFDGQRLAELCLTHGVCVSSGAFELTSPDFAQLESLRAGP